MPKNSRRQADLVRREIEEGLRDYQELLEDGLLENPTGPPSRVNYAWPPGVDTVDIAGPMPFGRLCHFLRDTAPQGCCQAAD